MPVTQILFGYSGRIGRSTFWLASLAAGLVIGVLFVILSAVAGPAGMLMAIPFIWTTSAISAKRLHDRGKSGWWQLLGIAAIVPSLLAVYLAATLGPLAMVFSLVGAVMSLWSLWISLQIMFFPGDSSSNDYGDSPKLHKFAEAEASPEAMAGAYAAIEQAARKTAAVTAAPAQSAAPAERRSGSGNRPGGSPERRRPQGFGRRAPA